MPNATGFTLTEVLISLFILCLAGLGALSVSVIARQQVITATQQTIALSLAAELAGRMASHNNAAEHYEGIHPLWAIEKPTYCSERYSCNESELSQFHLFTTLTASGDPQSLQLLQQPAFCIRRQADRTLLQLSWRSLTKVRIQRPTSVCDPSPYRLQVSLEVP